MAGRSQLKNVGQVESQSIVRKVCKSSYGKGAYIVMKFLENSRECTPPVTLESGSMYGVGKVGKV